jgi:hypothetical protein
MNLYPFIWQPPTPRNRLVRVVLVVVSTMNWLNIARKDTTVVNMRQARKLNPMTANDFHFCAAGSDSQQGPGLRDQDPNAFIGQGGIVGLSVIPNFKHPNVRLVGEIFTDNVPATRREFTHKTRRPFENFNKFVTPAILRHKLSSHCIHRQKFLKRKLGAFPNAPSLIIC